MIDIKREQVGIFSGSFNPIHVGHLVLANYMCEFANLDEVWFVVSPQNPLKKYSDLLADDVRLQMVEMALADFDKIKVCDIEYSMPKPSYTCDTLKCLKDKYPNKDFTLIIGEDNWAKFDKWKNHNYIMENYNLLIYPRLHSQSENVDAPFGFSNSIKMVEAPIIEISSTFIRKSVSKGKNMRAFLPQNVYDFYLLQMI